MICYIFICHPRKQRRICASKGQVQSSSWSGMWQGHSLNIVSFHMTQCVIMLLCLVKYSCSLKYDVYIMVNGTVRPPRLLFQMISLYCFEWYNPLAPFHDFPFYMYMYVKDCLCFSASTIAVPEASKRPNIMRQSVGLNLPAFSKIKFPFIF